jgi:hypothetical protein
MDVIFGELEWNYQKEAKQRGCCKSNWGQGVSKLYWNKITKRYCN